MKKEKEKATDEIVIRSLSDAQAVRTRPGMYVGGVENPDLIFREVIDGSFDESYATGCDSVLISTNFNNYYFVADNGRGIPCTMSLDDPTKTQALLAMSKLHAGSKFETTGIRAGMHGCGESATNFLSSHFVLFSKITQDNFDKSTKEVFDLWNSCGPRSKKDLFYVIAFQEGNLVYEGALKKVDAEKYFFGTEFPEGYTELPSGYSTMVMFRPDPKIFTSTKASLPVQNIQNFLLIQEKFYGRKVCVNVDGVEMTSSTFSPYKFEFIKTIVPADTTLNDQVSVYVTFELDQTLGGKSESGSVNGLTVNQGIHITWLETLFDEALKDEFGIKHRFTCNGLKMYVILLAGEVLYDSQTKTRLKSISKVKITDLSDIKKEFIKVFRKNPDEVGSYVEKLNFLADSMKTLSASEKAQKIIDDAGGRGLYKLKGEVTNGFADATAPDRWNCSLFLCFTGDTEILTCNDEKISFVDLVNRLENGENIYTFSCKSTGEIISAKILTAKKIKETDKLCKITLDNGEVIKCTPDHEMMLRDGSYKKAEELVSGDSMMPYITKAGLFKEFEANDNCKVISIEKLNLDNPEDVYCLEVDTPEHNFPLAAGIFTKNCEGLSAAGSLKKGRKDTRYNGVMPLRGKVKNVKDSSADQMMDNKELFTIFKMIGLGIDVNNVTKDAKTPEEAYALIQKYSRYGKIVIATD